MNVSIPQNPDPVLSESLRDTTAAGNVRPAGGAIKYAFASGSRPLDGYTIKRGVGRGGFGEVYFATSDAGKEVALKCIRRNLEIELRGVSQCLNLKHQNLVSLFDIRQDAEENFWVVMEFVAGESLEQIIAAHPGGLPAEQVLSFIRQIGGGVGYLHDRGIVHRDLKPGNIFLDEGTFKIGDYGLSKFISHSRRSGQTESIGTVHYMAPEIANGRYGKEIDIYALGIIFYEMLTGRVPYEGESLGEVLMKHLTAEPDLSGIAEPYRSVVARLLHKNPDARYPTVQAMLADLDAGLAGQPLSAPAPSPGTPGEGRGEGLPRVAQAPQATPLPGTQARGGAAAQAAPSSPSPPPRLMKVSSGAPVSGVCGGFARYYGIDPLWIRLTVFITAMFTGFFAVGGIYLLLDWLMPSDEEEIPTAQSDKSGAGLSIDMGQFCKAAGRLTLASILGVSIGLLTGGLAEALLPRALGYNRYDPGILAGVSVGLITAAGIGWLWLQSTSSSFLRVLLSLLLGGGVGVAAALLAFIGGAFENIAGLVGAGVAFLTAGIAICMTLSFTRVAWRVLPPLFFGLAAGLLVGAAGVIVGGVRDELPGVLGAGSGLLVCATTAWLLFFGPLAITATRSADQAPIHATRVWNDGGAAGGNVAADSDMPYVIPKAVKFLILLAVILASVPLLMHLLFRNGPSDYTPPVKVQNTLAADGAENKRDSVPQRTLLGSDRTGSTDAIRQSGQRRCINSSCGNAATTMLQVESFDHRGAIETYHYCEVHTRKRILQAQEAGMNYNRIDISGKE